MFFECHSVPAPFWPSGIPHILTLADLAHRLFHTALCLWWATTSHLSLPLADIQFLCPQTPGYTRQALWVILMKHHPNIARGVEKFPHGRLGTQHTDLLSKQFLTISLWPLWWLWTTFSRIPFPVWFWARVGHMTQLAQDIEGGNEAAAIISVPWRRPGCACRQLSDLLSP